MGSRESKGGSVRVHTFAEGCRLLRREWREVDGCVVNWHSGVEKQVIRMLRAGQTRREVEMLFNHEHMGVSLSAFNCQKNEEWEDDDVQVIAEVFAAMVERGLKQQFPGRDFSIEIRRDEEDITVVYWQAAGGETPG